MERVSPWLYKKLMATRLVLPECPYCGKTYEFAEMLSHLKLDESLIAQEADEIIHFMMSEIDIDENGVPIIDGPEDYRDN